MLEGLGDNGGRGETRLPEPGSPVLDRIPVGACGFVPFGSRLEGEQHLDTFGIDPLAPVTTDQRGVGRPQGGACDVGAVELSTLAAPPLRPLPAAVAAVEHRSNADSNGQGVDTRTSSAKADARKARRTPAPRRGGRDRHRGQIPLWSTLRRLENQADFNQRRVEIMERIARRFHHSMGCISWLPVSEFGDPDHRFGFLYDERDGTGLDHRPALAVDPGNRRDADYIFLKFAHRDNCQSAPTRPGTPGSPGTADPAKLGRPPASSIRSRLRVLERRLEDLQRRSRRLDGMSERFDEWESCLSWIPVTEYGDPDGGFGYRFRSPGGESVFRPALAVDVSEWDDPDYEFLAFEGHDRPFSNRDCEGEPGESVDKRLAPSGSGKAHASKRRGRSSLRDRVVDARQELGSLGEEIEDLGEPVEEFDTFDQCMHVIGVTEYGSRSRGVWIPLRCEPQPEARVRDGHARLRPPGVPAARLPG